MTHIFRTTSIVIVLASLATMATADQTPRRKSHKASSIAKSEVVLARPSAELAPMLGTWTLRSGDKPRTDIKMVFRPNGTFAFVGSNWKSSGSFRLAEHKLCLEWSSVDGSSVPAGTMKKDFPVAGDNKSFSIDQYTYYKLER